MKLCASSTDVSLRKFDKWHTKKIEREIKYKSQMEEHLSLLFRNVEETLHILGL